MRKLLLMEDDCAPDGWITFNKSFLEITDMPKTKFIEASKHHTPDNGYTNYYTLSEYQLEISADDPYLKLYKIEEK